MGYIFSQNPNPRLWALFCTINLLLHACPSTQLSRDTEQQPSMIFRSQQRTQAEGRFLKSLEHDAAGTVFSVDSHGAKGDGTSDDTQAFTAAWNASCSSSSSSVFLVPEGKKYLVHPINLKGPCQATNLTVQISGTIVAPDDPTNWDSQSPSAWLQFNNLKGVTIQGGGTIDGSGQKWWANSCKTNPSKSCKAAPTLFNVYAVRIGGGGNLKQAITMDSGEQVILQNLNIQNSQQIHLVISRSTNVQLENLQITAPEDSPNTDGIHIAGSQHVVIQNCTVGTGDDCVSIVTESSDIKINKLVCGPGHGISIGSLGKENAKDTVSEIVVDGATLTGTTNGLRIKTWQGGLGSAQGITFQNVVMNNVSNPIIIDQYYCDSPKPCQNQTSAVQVSNVTFKDITGTSATSEAIRLACSETVTCQNIAVENVKLQTVKGDPATAFFKSAHVLSKGQVIPPLQ